MADEGAKKQRRDIEKKMTVHVQQICGTQQQVRARVGLLMLRLRVLPAWLMGQPSLRCSFHRPCRMLRNS